MKLTVWYTHQDNTIFYFNGSILYILLDTVKKPIFFFLNLVAFKKHFAPTDGVKVGASHLKNHSQIQLDLFIQAK